MADNTPSRVRVPDNDAINHMTVDDPSRGRALLPQGCSWRESGKLKHSGPETASPYEQPP